MLAKPSKWPKISKISFRRKPPKNHNKTVLFSVIERPKSVIKIHTMKAKTLLSLAVLFILFAAVSCSKKDSTPKTNLEYLSQAIWKFQDAGLDADENGSIDASDPTVTACKKDNTLDFNTDYSGVADEGASKCNEGDPQSTVFGWTFSENETQLEYYDVDMGGGQMYHYVVLMKH
jgi:hypothetical protein